MSSNEQTNVIEEVTTNLEKVVDPELYDLDLYGDGDVADIECGSCGEPFLIKAHVSYTYTTCPDTLSDYYEDY